MEKMSNTFSCPIWPNPYKWLMNNPKFRTQPGRTMLLKL